MPSSAVPGVESDILLLRDDVCQRATSRQTCFMVQSIQYQIWPLEACRSGQSKVVVGMTSCLTTQLCVMMQIELRPDPSQHSTAHCTAILDGLAGVAAFSSPKASVKHAELSKNTCSAKLGHTSARYNTHPHPPISLVHACWLRRRCPCQQHDTQIQ